MISDMQANAVARETKMASRIKRLFLRAFEYNDLDFINMLRNDDSLFELTCGNKYYISSERDRKWLEDKIFNNSNQLYLMICSADDSRPVGYTSAVNIDYINRKAEWSGILIAGEFSGKGYGTECGSLVLNHLFGELGMNMVYAYVREGHSASLRMVEKLGFQVNGLIRDFGFKRNHFFNVHIVTILKSEFEAAAKNLL